MTYITFIAKKKINEKEKKNERRKRNIKPKIVYGSQIENNISKTQRQTKKDSSQFNLIY